MLSQTLNNILHLMLLKVVILLLLLTNPQCYAEEGVFSRKIVLATHQPLSGPAHEYSEIGKSALAYFKYVNDQGGIHGRAIELIMFDDQLKPEITVKDFAEFFRSAGNSIFDYTGPIHYKKSLKVLTPTGARRPRQSRGV